jgi:acetate kinase
VRLFEHFPADKVEDIVSQGQLATYEGNEAILETGDDSKYIGADQRPREISVTDNTGTRTVLSQLGPGDVFGVMSTLTGERMSADVIAGNRCSCC